MVDQASFLHGSLTMQGLLQGIEDRAKAATGSTPWRGSVRADRETRHAVTRKGFACKSRRATMRSATVSMTKAPYIKPCHMDT